MIKTQKRIVCKPESLFRDCRCKMMKTPRLYQSCGLRAHSGSLLFQFYRNVAMSTGFRIVSGCFRDTVGIEEL